MSRARSVLRALAALGLGAALFALTGEVAVRALDPSPGGQVVRPRQGTRGIDGFRVVDGEPLWTHEGSGPRQDPGCGPDARTVLLLGSSIFWGTGYAPEQVVSARLQERLDPTRQRVCVRNHAQPAYVGSNKLVEARELIPRLRPAVVVWEVWTSDAASYVVLDGVAYNMGQSRVDEAGYPVILPGVPASVHHALFRRSALWRYGHLSQLRQDPEVYEARWRAHLATRMPELARLTADAGGRLLLAFVPPLDRPFATFAADVVDKKRGYWWVREWADAAAVPWVDVATELAGRDVEALRHDPCCHYNPDGHAALADLLAPRVEAALAAGAPTP